MTRSTACLMLLCAAFFWGVGNVANKTVLEHIGPLSVVGLRALLAALIVAPLALHEYRLASGHRLSANPGAPSTDAPAMGQPGTAWLQSAACVALLFAGALSLQQIAYGYTTVTNASFLVNTASILTPLIGWAAFGHRPSARIAAAAAVTVAGAFLMAGQVSLVRFNQGDLACLGSALFYAGWMVALGHHAMRYRRPFATSLVQFVVTAALLLPAALLAETLSWPVIRAALPEVLVLGLFSTAAAFVLQTWAQAHVAAPTAAVLVSAESLFGAAGAWLLLSEQTPAAGLAGAALILTGIVIAATGQMETLPAAPLKAPPNAARTVKQKP